VVVVTDPRPGRRTQRLLDRACAMSRGFLLVRNRDPAMGVVLCRGFLLTLDEMRRDGPGSV